MGADKPKVHRSFPRLVAHLVYIVAVDLVDYPVLRFYRYSFRVFLDYLADDFPAVDSDDDVGESGGNENRDGNNEENQKDKTAEGASV